MVVMATARAARYWGLVPLAATKIETEEMGRTNGLGPRQAA
jgi:hypothetical protein